MVLEVLLLLFSVILGFFVEIFEPEKKEMQGDKTMEPVEKRMRTSSAEQSANGEVRPTVSEDVLKVLDELDAEPLDERGVKKLILGLEKATLRNQEMRVKFSDEPAKFMEAELELNSAIQEMHAVATAPSFYGLLIELNAVETLLQLLTHENTDIVVATINLLQELTDVEDETEEEEDGGGRRLAQHLVEWGGDEGGQMLNSLVASMDRLDDSDGSSDEADGIHNAMALVENLVDLVGEAICAAAAELIGWLLRRVKRRGPLDDNKLYAGELLGVLLQNSEKSRKCLGQRDGIDVLLQCLAAFKRRDPASAGEREHMENLFDCLCASLSLAANRRRFLEGEGLQLMNLMLRERKESRFGALKVLDHATSGPDNEANCDKLVEILGLRTLFPLFMKTPSRRRRGVDRPAGEVEEHVLAVVAALLRHCSASGRGRVLAKFAENDHAKLDRLVELHFAYAAKVAAFERVAADDRDEKQEEEGEERYLKRLDAGLFALQLIDAILADVWVTGISVVKNRVNKLLAIKAENLSAVSAVLRTYVDNLGEEAAAEKKRVLDLIAKLR